MYKKSWFSIADTFDQPLDVGSTPTFAGATLSGLTASTVIYSNASKAITSLANSAGYLLNDGSGGLSWGAVSFAGYLKADRSIALTGVTGPALIAIDADEKFATLDGVAAGQVLISQGTTTAPAYSASPVLTDVLGVSGSGADQDGTAINIKGGQSTGTGTPGSVILNVGTTSTTGSSANAYQTTPAFTLALDGKITQQAYLSNETGAEAAFTLNYTTNKAAGDDRGLVINQTDTVSGGTSYLIDAQVATASKFSVTNGGSVAGIYFVTASSGAFTSSGNNDPVSICTSRSYSTASKFAIVSALGNFSQTSGANGFLSLSGTYNQTSGTAANTDLLINRTETAVGSGTQRLLSAQVGGVEKVGLDNRGGIMVGMTPDAIMQVGMVAMADAGTDERYDVNGAGGTLPIGIVGGSGATAAGTARALVVRGICYVAPAEDVVSITRGHVCFVDGSDAGYVDDNAALQAVGLNIGRYITSEAAVAFNGADDVAADGTITLDSDPTTWAIGDPVIYWDSGDTAPAELTTGGVYWIQAKTGAAVKLAATRGGAAITLTDGSGTTMYLMRLPKVILHWQ